MATSRNILLKAVLLSPLAALAGSPLFAAWLLARYTSESLLSAAAFKVIFKMAVIWGLGATLVAYLVLGTYGLLVRTLLTRFGSARLIWFIAAGVLPGVLLLLTALPYQESAVPTMYFGALVFAAFWYLSVKRAGLGANNSFKPNLLRKSA